MWNAGLDKAQAGIKIARRDVNNLRHADDTTLLAESWEELKSVLMTVKKRVKKLASSSTFRKLRSLASGPITSWQIDGETVRDFIFGGAPESLQMVTVAMILKDTWSLEEKL